jgi:hypothetical protein
MRTSSSKSLGVIRVRRPACLTTFAREADAWGSTHASWYDQIAYGVRGSFCDDLNEQATDLMTSVLYASERAKHAAFTDL